MQGAAVLVGRGHVGAEARLGLHGVGQGEVGRELLRLQGAQVEVAAGGSVRMLRPLKGGTWRERQGQREDPVRTGAPSLPRRCHQHPGGFLQLLKRRPFVRRKQGHCFYVQVVILDTPGKGPVPSMLEERGMLSLMNR